MRHLPAHSKINGSNLLINSRLSSCGTTFRCKFPVSRKDDALKSQFENTMHLERYFQNNFLKKGKEKCLQKQRLYPTNHHSSLEHATYGTSCLLLAFLIPTTCHLSNLRSINLILSLYPLSCSLSSFFLHWGFA